jgi:hypothetical protein
VAERVVVEIEDTTGEVAAVTRPSLTPTRVAARQPMPASVAIPKAVRATPDQMAAGTHRLHRRVPADPLARNRGCLGVVTAAT